MSYQVKAALVIVPDEQGSFHHFYQGTVLPGGLDEKRVKELAKEGFLEKVETPTEVGPAADSVEGILAAVGDDKAQAQSALDQENAKDKPRPSLVKKLEAIVNG